MIHRVMEWVVVVVAYLVAFFGLVLMAPGCRGESVTGPGEVVAGVGVGNVVPVAGNGDEPGDGPGVPLSHCRAVEVDARRVIYEGWDGIGLLVKGSSVFGPVYVRVWIGGLNEGRSRDYEPGRIFLPASVFPGPGVYRLVIAVEVDRDGDGQADVLADGSRLQCDGGLEVELVAPPRERPEPEPMPEPVCEEVNEPFASRSVATVDEREIRASYEANNAGSWWLQLWAGFPGDERHWVKRTVDVSLPCGESSVLALSYVHAGHPGCLWTVVEKGPGGYMSKRVVLDRCGEGGE
jgi:hypothetical protein